MQQSTASDLFLNLNASKLSLNCTFSHNAKTVIMNKMFCLMIWHYIFIHLDFSVHLASSSQPPPDYMKYAVERPFSWQWWSKLAPVRDGFDALLTIKNCKVGGSPGLVIVEGDSCSKGCGFESWRRILDGHFFTLLCCKNCIDRK